MHSISPTAHAGDCASPAMNYPDAAAYTCISERKLWSLAAPNGPIDTVRIGRRVLFLRSSLDAYMASQTVRQQPANA